MTNVDGAFIAPSSAASPQARQSRALAGASAALALTLSAVLPARAATEADVVYTGGKIYTLDARSSVASAVAVVNGRLVAVGSDADVRPYVGSRTQVVDLHGAAVIPGLNDTHVHLIDAGANVGRVDLAGAATASEALVRIKVAAGAKRPGEWVVGVSWSPTTQLAEKRYLTAAELDAAAPNNPVLLDGATVSVNSAAMRLAKIDRSTAAPEGGVIQKDSAGNPNGVFEASASRLVKAAIPPPTVDELAARYVAAAAYANTFGITSIVDPATSPTDVRALQRLKDEGRLTLRYSVMFPPPVGKTSQEFDAALTGVGAASGFGDEWLRTDYLGEMSVDGGMTFGTALMRQPYPHDAKYFGVASQTNEELNANVANGWRNGWRYSLHAVGDAGVDRLLDAYEAAAKVRPIAGRRFAVLRGSLIQRDQLERMKRLGVVLHIQNMFMWDKGPAVERNLGAAVAQRAMPARMAIEVLGIDNVSQGSDFPTNTLSPWVNLHLSVTRLDQTGKAYGADQAIGREEALRIYTVSGAHMSFEAAIKGSLEPGKVADMVVLDRDYMTVPTEQIKDIRAMKTIVGGKVVFSR